MSDSVKVKAGYLNGTVIRCSMCLKTKDAGRVYDFEVALMDPLTGYTVASRGVATICESCRTDFHYADMELDAPEMERQARERDAEEACSPEYDDLPHREPNRHWTFPADKG